MFMMFDLIIAIFLEKKFFKNSKNSNKSSSTDQKDDSSTSKPGTNEKRKTKNKTVADNSRTVENTVTVEVAYCDVCGHDLRKTKCKHHEVRTKIDIVFEKVIERVSAEVKQCPNCDAINKGKFPEDMPGPLQYGNGLKAYSINLLVCQMISLNRVQKMTQAIIGEVISEATFLKFIKTLYEKLEPWELSSTKLLLKSNAINVDETSMRVDKNNYWIHVYSSLNITLKFLHRKRGIEAIEAINIIPNYHNVIIHDCWSSYLSYKHCDHGLCGAHLVRELQGVVEFNNYQWAFNMKKLLLETCKKVAKKKNKKLTKKEYVNLQKRYRNILTRGEKELPDIKAKQEGQRGKIAKSEAHNLFARFREYESFILLFAKKSEVSFTNNRAERDLRMAKVKQKVSGCFRTEFYAKAYCRISSYIQTMDNKGYNPLIAIQRALEGKFT